MDVVLKGMNGRKYEINNIKKDQTVTSLKKRLVEKTSIPTEGQMVVYNAQMLFDESKPLEFYGVKDGATLHFMPRLYGGLSHLDPYLYPLLKNGWFNVHPVLKTGSKMLECESKISKDECTFTFFFEEITKYFGSRVRTEDLEKLENKKINNQNERMNHLIKPDLRHLIFMDSDNEVKSSYTLSIYKFSDFEYLSRIKDPKFLVFLTKGSFGVRKWSEWVDIVIHNLNLFGTGHPKIPKREEMERKIKVRNLEENEEYVCVFQFANNSDCKIVFKFCTI